MKTQRYVLGDICTRLSSGKSINAEDISDRGLFPVYGGNGIRGYTNSSNFEGECVLIGRQGAYCGNVRYFTGEGYITEHAIALSADENHNTKYIGFVLDRMNLGLLSHQAAQPGISVGVLAKQPIELPDKNTQNKIANIINHYDDLIENNQKQIKLLEEAAQRLYKEWFVDLHFPGHENVKIVDGVPEGWLSSSLEKLSILKAGGDRPKVFSEIRSMECNVPVYANGSDDEGLYGFTDKAVVMNKSITVSARGNIGYTCLRRKPFVPIVRLICIMPKEEVLEYLYYVIKNSSIQGNGSAQQQLTIPMIKDFNVLLPSSNILHRFNNKVSIFLECIDALKSNITLLKEARDRLLPKLMSGEIEV